MTQIQEPQIKDLNQTSTGDQNAQNVADTPAAPKGGLIALIGAPCSGKGTLAERALPEAARRGLPVRHVSTGELLREQASRDPRLAAQLASGALNPDEDVRALVIKAAEQAERDGVWLLLDGAPRRASQLEWLRSSPQGQRGQAQLALLSAPDEVLRERRTKRAAHAGRPEDTEETFETRLKLFKKETQTLREVLSSSEVLPITELDGSGEPPVGALLALMGLERETPKERLAAAAVPRLRAALDWITQPDNKAKVVTALVVTSAALEVAATLYAYRRLSQRSQSGQRSQNGQRRAKTR